MHRLFILFWLGWACYQPIAHAAEPQKILLATAEWEPYISETKPGHGKFAEIVSAVFKEVGMETEFIFAPWKRTEMLVKNGDVYAAIPYSYTEERAKVFNYSTPIMNSEYVFFYLKKNYPKGINYTKLEDLAGYHIGGVTGYWYETSFAQAKLKVEYVTTDEQGIMKLHLNRIDLAATDKLVGLALIKKLYPQQISEFGMIEKPFATQELHLMVSKKYPNAAAITEKFNATFHKLNENKPIVFN